MGWRFWHFYNYCIKIPTIYFWLKNPHPGVSVLWSIFLLVLIKKIPNLGQTTPTKILTPTVPPRRRYRQVHCEGGGNTCPHQAKWATLTPSKTITAPAQLDSNSLPSVRTWGVTRGHQLRHRLTDVIFYPSYTLLGLTFVKFITGELHRIKHNTTLHLTYYFTNKCG